MKKWLSCVLAACMLLGGFVLSAQAEDTQVITILGGGLSPAFSEAYAMVQEKYPGVQLNFESSDGDKKSVAEALIAGEAQYDIVSVSEYSPLNSRALYNAGALEDLSQYPGIMANLEAMNGIQNIYRQDGAVFGVPQHTNLYLFSINEELFRQLGLSVPQSGWTWDDFFALGDEILRINQESGKNYTLLAGPGIRIVQGNYDANELHKYGTVDYDNPVHRNLVQRWKELANAGVIASSGAGDGNLFGVQEFTYAYLGMYRLIELPAYAPDSATHFVQYSYVLNRNAPNKEAAAYFLECLISRSALQLTYPDVSMGYLADVTPADVEQQHSSLRNNPKWIGISEENHQIWLDAMANGMPENYAIADASRTQWKELFPSYLNDEITLDQYIAALQQNMDAVLGQ